WHDHVLFTGNAVTGIIDYGSVRHDHPAVDLARLLGSLAGDDGDLTAAGLAAYRGVRQLGAGVGELSRVLDVTGTVLGLANWLFMLYCEERQFDDRGAIARRMQELVTRLERWPRLPV